MTPNLSRYLDKIIFVSIPALFEDGVCRPYKLLGAEMNGLWLQSDELTRRLLPDEGHQLASLDPVVFVPLAQIAGVLVATSMPDQQAAPAAAPPTPAEEPSDAPAEGSGRTGAAPYPPEGKPPRKQPKKR